MLAFTVEGGFPVQSTDSDANSSGDVPTHLPRNHVLSVIWGSLVQSSTHTNYHKLTH
jgi:hypothetical protein